MSGFMNLRTREAYLKLGAVLLLAGVSAWAQQPPLPGLPSNPNELVRRAISNELQPNNDKTHYTYRLTKVKPEHVEVREMIETDQGTIGRLLLLNGKPLPPDQREKEDKRLQRLVDDPSALQAKQKSQREDDQRTRRMVAALPDAFIYQYAGKQEAAPWGQLVLLTFKPNPDFDPPSRETLVYRGMEGTMAIAVPSYRLAKIEAKLFRDVTFGWGILGHLDSGGRFVVEQKPVNGEHWEPSHMVLNFTGKALVFKTIKIEEDEITTDYRPVPPMSAAHAVDLLKKREGEVAQNQAQNQPAR